MRRVLYDTNILLDVTLKREPYLTASAAALDAVGQGQVEGYVAGHAVTTLFYVRTVSDFAKGTIPAVLPEVFRP